MNLRIVVRESEFPMDSRVVFLLPSEGEATAEDLAMLQALYSRNPSSITSAYKLIQTTKSGDFMSRYYVGYNHSSIGELGNVTIAIENVPMNVAKLIQHSRLYKGQESSTRYIDFSKQPFISRSNEQNEFQEKTREFYINALPIVIDHVANVNQMSTDDPAELRTIKAASFDILRGFLPTGATTNVAWTTDLRLLNETINNLRPYEDQVYLLKNVLDKLDSLMLEVFPNSRRDRNPVPNEDLFFDDFPFQLPRVCLNKLRSSPMGRKNPRRYIELEALLDFASWRDFARHRSIQQTFPVINTNNGFEQWYLDQLPESLKDEARTLIERSKQLNDPLTTLMGFRVKFYAGGLLDAWNYIIKTRTAQTVHPTLRKLMHYVLDALPNTFKDLDCDRNPDWVLSKKRGQQTIQLKSEVVK